MLVPFYFLIGAWGRGDAVAATTKLVIFTLVGSLLMLAAAVALGVIATPPGEQISFALSELAQRAIPEGTQYWIFLLFAFAFLVKMPAFPLHGWMPDGYRAAPLPVLLVFSAVVSKVAAYGFLRIVLPVMPDAAAHFQDLILLLAVLSILYGSIQAFTADDARLVLGYSSVAQLGFITLGIFSFTELGAQGAVIQMVNHGIVVAALFLIVGFLAARAGGSDSLSEMGGIATRAPILAALFLIAALASLAMPGSANFVGELYILFGAFDSKLVIGLVASAGVALAAVYMIRMYQRSMHNRVGPAVQSREISRGDIATLAPLVLVIVGLGVYPQLLLAPSKEAASTAVRTAGVLSGSIEPIQPAAAAEKTGAKPAEGGEGE
jgi:NADH-quinone oxidoreductase subunit M